MELKIDKKFKSVEFMRKARAEMTELYNNDKAKFHTELKKAMSDFLEKRKKASIK